MPSKLVSSSEKPQSGRFPNLDYLRLFLALEVVAMHCYNGQKPGSFVPPISPVPAFVCISGYLIPASMRSSKSWKHFAFKRLLRVGPVFILSFVLVGALFGPNGLWPTFLYYLTIGLATVPTLNGPLWSLSLEEILYALHTLFARVWNARGFAICFSLAMLGWLALRLGILALSKDLPAEQLAQNLAINRIIGTAATFFAGNLLFAYKDHLANAGFWKPALALVACIASTLFIDGYSLFHLVLWPLSSVLAVLTAVNAPQLRALKLDISYSVYAFHLPILTVLSPKLVGYGGPAMAAVVATTIPVSLVSWYLVEERFLRLKNRYFTAVEAS